MELAFIIIMPKMETTEGTNLSTQVCISVKLELRSGNVVLKSVSKCCNYDSD